MRLTLRVLRVASVERARGHARVTFEGEDRPGIAYAGFVPEVQPGDEVLVNTTAVEMGLGTGGTHFVLANLTRPEVSRREDGHIMKLRYTPLQFAVPVVEEEDAYLAVEGRRVEAPVVVALLHSQIAPTVLAFRSGRERSRVTVVVDDGCALPAALSGALAAMKEDGLVDWVVTCGHAFGGDFEAVNRYSALLHAAGPLASDLVVVAPGPGMPGTASRFGNAAVYAADALNAACALGGTPLLALRASAADERDRHRGVSHHAVTACELALGRVTVAVPDLSSAGLELDDRTRALFEARIAEIAALPNVTVRAIDMWGWREALAGREGLLRTMGRGLADDPLFFASAAAAGRAALGEVVAG